MSKDLQTIRVRGAAEHNLKHIDIDLPRGEFVVITGLSGSGKSSLAFDTIYAEGQRRYVESLSAYARQFLEMMQKPDVESIEGLSPAISIEQKTTSRNPRSTVATVTEIYDYMRLLWARVGVPYSPATGLPIESQSVAQMVDRTLSMEEGTRFYLLAPIVRDRKGEYRKEFADWLQRGFQRVKIDGVFHELDDPPELNRKLKHTIDVVVDRLVIREGLASRLASSFETALELADGLAVIEIADDTQDKPERVLYSARFACPVSGFTLPEIEPRLFSFNNPTGACTQCDGIGRRVRIDPDLVIPDPDKTLAKGAIAPWSSGVSTFQRVILKAVAKAYDFDLDTPWRHLSPENTKIILYGSGKQKLTFSFSNQKRRFEYSKAFEGVIPSLERRFRETDSNWAREEISKYQSESPCIACEGMRLRPEALCVKIADAHIGTVSQLSIRDAANWFSRVEDTLSKTQRHIAERILKEIRDRLRFLNDVGLDYLTLSRNSGTLSGGESQRIRLASQIGSGLTGVLYVLDEPSIGLHQRDNARLLKTLERLRDLGNSVIVVEHDEDAILAADHVVDMGPRAGIHGGQVVAQGKPADIIASKDSLTGQYLSGVEAVPIPKKRRKGRKGVKLTGAGGNNLHTIDAEFPLGVLTCVTGVSGSGKSTLVMETLYRALARQLSGAIAAPAPYEKLENADRLDKIIHIDQSPIGRTPRSNPATYTGAFGPIRDWYAGLPEAKIRGYGPGRFSFNVKGGRCEACKGDGVVRIEMHFLPDVYVTCEECGGRRYNRETLEVLYRDKSIHDVLDMNVSEAAKFFETVRPISSRMELLEQVGMGYVKVGQQATTLSGGEAQRVKLARELSKRATGRTFYILDEPTTGLHFEDVRRLMEVLQKLVDTGNTVVVIEHNLDVIRAADWVIDLGPGGGDRGGEIVATGTPEQVAVCGKGETSGFLAEALARYKKFGKKKERIQPEKSKE